MICNTRCLKKWLKTLSLLLVLASVTRLTLASPPETKPTPAVCKANLKEWTEQKTESLTIDQIFERMNTMVACADESHHHRHSDKKTLGYRTLLGFEGANYTIEKLAARIGKRPQDVAERLKLLDLTEPIASAFVAGHIGLGHALLIAKLAADVQEKALAHCFDGYYAANDADRSLVRVSRLQAWIAQNIYLSLKSVPFSKDDETLVPVAGSCANCPKRTGFNALLFSEVREDSCADAACFNRKLDAHIVQRVTKMSNLI